jgi:PAS domain-containing protein
MEEGLRRSEESARESEKELEKIFNLTPGMVCICTTEGELLKVNPSCEEI